MGYEPLSNLKKVRRYIMVLNNVTKFHKVVSKITGLSDQTPLKLVNFYEQRAKTPEGIVRYGPLLYNL